ncbi:MAG: M20/M25/M40 family metallo-hydrolase [Acidobacteriota bacterium]
MKTVNWEKFGEKVRMAVSSSLESHFERGTSGMELEFNILDSQLRPVLTVGYGPEQRSFADYFHDQHLPAWLGERAQLEVFHWMTEVATRPYYHPMGTALEARLLEAAVFNALARAGLEFGETFGALHGNLLYRVAPGEKSIPGGWPLAKRRYLAQCVARYGERLATAGIHTNHSYPEALLSWDFFHLPRHRREGRTLIDYRNEAVIRATRLLRPFCPLFIAVTASTPLAAAPGGGAELTENDSNRLLTFPNPPELDVPYLYASYADYLRISYDLVRKGVRFGANNWTPVRARSDVDPVNRNISATSEQLRELYRLGLYSVDERQSLDETERQLTIENLCARVDLPMNRVEVRTDEGGESLDLCLAKIAFKELLMYRIYGDPAFGAQYAYDAEDVDRARRNEDAAARKGLQAEIEHPLRGGKCSVRDFLKETLDDLAPLARALDYESFLGPLRHMAQGGPNPAESIRLWFRGRIGEDERAVPPALLDEWVRGRAEGVGRELETLSNKMLALGDEEAKLAEILDPFQEETKRDPSLPCRLAPERPAAVQAGGDVTSDVLALASSLVAIPSVTNCADERLDEVERCARFIAAALKESGAEVRIFDSEAYPAVLAGFPGAQLAPVTLGGHFDVVAPDPNDTQFEPRIEGDYFWGRGSADMKTVVASNIIWMRRALQKGPPYPPVNLLLVGNEENGETSPFGTPHVLKALRRESAWSPEFMILGERTGERGDERFGKICTANRGVVRLLISAKGERGHTGMSAAPADLLERLVSARSAMDDLLHDWLTLSDEQEWQSSYRFPFLNVGETGVYNITPDEAWLGLEIRPIPEEDLDGLLDRLNRIAGELELQITPQVREAGVACPPENVHLAYLLGAMQDVSGRPAEVSRKLAGTSARFSPGGNAVVWGQSGKGPHSRHECHFIPSIAPYIEVLDRFAERQKTKT